MTDSVPKDEAATTPPAATDEKPSTQNRVSWTREHWFSFWSNVASFLNAGFAAVAFLILVLTLRATQESLSAAQRSIEEARRQADAAVEQVRIAKDALIATDRPWVQVSGFKVDYVNISSGYFIASTKIMLKNVGHSPALNVWVFPEIKARDLQSGDITAGLSSVCARAKIMHPTPPVKDNGMGSAIIFPGEESTLTDEEVTFIVSTSRIESELAATKEADVYLNGCAVYSSPSDNNIHGTSFGTVILRRCGTPTGTCPFNWKTAAIITDDGLAARQPNFGRTAD